MVVPVELTLQSPARASQPQEHTFSHPPVQPHATLRSPCSNTTPSLAVFLLATRNFSNSPSEGSSTMLTTMTKSAYATPVRFVRANALDGYSHLSHGGQCPLTRHGSIHY